jgi:type I restriction enzyme S subunit
MQKLSQKLRICFRLNTSCSKAVDIDYLFWALQRSKRSIIALGQGGAQPNISQRILLQCQIPLAPRAEQRRIVARVEALFSEIAEGEAALTEARKGLDTFRRALLKAAVTGELTKDWRAANPVAETGHDLLTRIVKDRASQTTAKGRGRRSADTSPLDTSI